MGHHYQEDDGDRPNPYVKPEDKSPTRKTQTYSFVDPERQDKQMLLTVKDVIASLIEKDVVAWKLLPQSVKDLMLANPGRFVLTSDVNSTNGVPKITVSGVTFRWVNPNWVLMEING